MNEREFIKFPDIGQFRQTCKDAPKTTLKFTGTVKLHGTNAGVVITNEDIYAQSRNRIITPSDDNLGFAKFVHDNLGPFCRVFRDANARIVLFGEWCGKGIQRGVAISQLDKMFVVFAAKLGDEWVADTVWDTWLKNAQIKQYGIYSILDFPAFTIDIDFNQPELSIDRLREITEAVEGKCPVAATLGVDGVGEGIVWKNEQYGLLFKVKGEKHSVSKVKTLAAVDTVKLTSIQEFLDYALTENRMKQAVAEVANDMDIRKLGDFLRWLFNDIVKEESDTMADSGIEQKEIGRYISARAKTWYLNKSQVS